MDQATFWEGCPVVEIIPGKVSGAPLLKGARIPAMGVLDNADGGLSPEEIASVFDLDSAVARAVIEHARRQGYFDDPC